MSREPKEIEKFVELINFFPIGITISDEEGNIIASNQEGARLLGLKQEEQAYWTLDDPKWHVIRKDHTIMSPEEYPSVRALKEGRRVENMELGIVKGEEINWINITATPLPAGRGVIVAYVDISDSIRRENELEHLNQKLNELIADRNKFFRIIAHDLRNPFTAIFGFCDLLLDNISQYPIEEIEMYIQVIRNTSKQTFDLLENLLEWSRSQAGLLEFHPDNVDLSILVAEALKFVRSQAKQKNISFCYQFDKHSIGYADNNMMNTVIRNLLTNAIKYSYPNSEVSVTVKDLYNEVSIGVKDRGIGMDKEKIENLFKKDQKQSTIGTENETGSGLGLLISKEFIDKHKGEMRIESEVGKGTEFIITIPKRVVE